METVNVLNQIINLLDFNNIPYKLSEHVEVKTSQEAADIRGVELKTGAKALIIKTKSSHVLFVMPADRQLDLRKVKNILGVKDASLTPREEAEELTGLKMGCVPPFGNLLGLQTYIDEAVLENEKINFSAARLTHSIQMNPEDLVKLVNPVIGDYTKEL